MPLWREALQNVTSYTRLQERGGWFSVNTPGSEPDNSGVRLARGEGRGDSGVKLWLGSGVGEETWAAAISCSVCPRRRRQRSVKIAGLDHRWESG